MLDALINHVIHKQISEKNREMIDIQFHIENMEYHLKNIREYQRPHKIQAQKRLIQVLLQKETKIQCAINNLEILCESRQHTTIRSPFESGLANPANKTT